MKDILKDRFAAAWENFSGRHKGRRVGTLWAKYDEGTGDATLTVDLLESHPLLRADILKDCIFVLQVEYEQALNDMSNPKKVTQN